MLLGPQLRVCFKGVEAGIPYFLLQNISNVALVRKLCNRRKTRGRAGISRKDNKFTVGGTSSGPFEIIRRFGRLAVLVGTQEGDVEIVSRIGEIVIVAAEKSSLLLRSKDGRLREE